MEKMNNEYHIHTETTNESFLKMYKMLKSEGIKNNKFFLALYDESLKFVDPFDKDLSIETKTKIVRECMRNYWYFIRECVRLPKIGGSASQYTLHKGNLAMAFCFLNNINQYTEISRLCYTSISVDVLLLWDSKFNGTCYARSSLIGLDEEDCRLDISKMVTIDKLLPEFLINNPESKYFNFEKLLRTCRTPKGKQAMDHMGRSLTTPIRWINNFAFIPNNDVLIHSSAPAASVARMQALSEGTNSSLIITSVPGKPGTESANYAYKYLTETLLFEERFYDMNIEELYKNIKYNSINKTVHIKYLYDKLGRDENWFNQQTCDLCHNQDVIDREILLKWDFLNTNI